MVTDFDRVQVDGPFRSHSSPAAVRRPRPARRTRSTGSRSTSRARRCASGRTARPGAAIRARRRRADPDRLSTRDLRAASVIGAGSLDIDRAKGLDRSHVCGQRPDRRRQRRCRPARPRPDRLRAGSISAARRSSCAHRPGHRRPRRGGLPRRRCRSRHRHGGRDRLLAVRTAKSAPTAPATSRSAAPPPARSQGSAVGNVQLRLARRI